MHSMQTSLGYSKGFQCSHLYIEEKVFGYVANSMKSRNERISRRCMNCCVYYSFYLYTGQDIILVSSKKKQVHGTYRKTNERMKVVKKHL